LQTAEGSCKVSWWELKMEVWRMWREAR